MPDSNDLETLQARLTDYRPQIVAAVHFACWSYKYKATPAESEDFIQDIIKLLLEDDCRRFQIFDSNKAVFETWLQSVTNRFVWRRVKKNRPTVLLEEQLLNTLSYAPRQEKELLRKEQRAKLYAAIDKLSLHDQQIARLKLLEIPDEEIARELNIKPASVGREWRVIQTTLKQIVTDGRQSKAKQSKAKQSKDVTPHENFCNIFYF